MEVQYKVFYDPRQHGAIKGISPVNAPNMPDMSFVLIDDGFAQQVFKKEIRLKDFYVKSFGVVEPSIARKSSEHDTVTTWHAWLQHPNNYLSHYDMKIQVKDGLLTVRKTSDRPFPSRPHVHFVDPNLSMIPVKSFMPDEEFLETGEWSVQPNTPIDVTWIPSVYGEFGTIHYEYLD